MFKKINRENKKGFTLAELLIVVAIIGVLVAVSIPIFTSQLEKSREATDAANIRDAYAIVMSASLTQDKQDELTKLNTDKITYTVSGAEGSYVYSATVKLTQQQDEWQTGAQDIGGVALAADTAKKNGIATVTYTQSTGKATITIAAGS